MIVTIVATGFEGSKFENATAKREPEVNLFGQTELPKQNGNFDKVKFNEFVAGKPMTSLFEKGGADFSQVQTPEMGQKFDGYSDKDLWNKLNMSRGHEQAVPQLKTEEELTVLAQRLKAKYPETLFYTSHCTGDIVFATLKTIMGAQLHAFSCGMIFATNSKQI